MNENPPPQDRPYQSPQQQPYQPPPAYGQQQGPPPPYQPSYGPPYVQGQGQYQQYGYPSAPAREHPQATLAFVLGLLSVLGLTILGPFGWYVGRKVVRQIDADPRSYTNRGLAMAGMVLGIIGTIFLILVLLFVVLAIIAAIVGSGASRHSTGSGGVGAFFAYWL